MENTKVLRFRGPHDICFDRFEGTHAAVDASASIRRTTEAFSVFKREGETRFAMEAGDRFGLNEVLLDGRLWDADCIFHEYLPSGDGHVYPARGEGSAETRDRCEDFLRPPKRDC